MTDDEQQIYDRICVACGELGLPSPGLSTTHIGGYPQVVRIGGLCEAGGRTQLLALLKAYKWTKALRKYLKKRSNYENSSPNN